MILERDERADVTEVRNMVLDIKRNLEELSRPVEMDYLERRVKNLEAEMD